MTHADAFLQDILAHPDDDAPRLIFADWLEEQGDAGSVARAEFIRVQCALAAGQVSEQQRAELARRELQLRNEWGKEWDGLIRRMGNQCNYHRGFIDEIIMEIEKFLMEADRLFGRAPIQHLILRHSRNPTSQYIAALADREHLRRLHSLNLSGNRLTSRDVRALLVSEHMTNLTALVLSSNRIGDGGLRALAGSPLLGRLERLDLRGNDIGAGGFRALAHALEKLDRSAEGSRLKRLELFEYGLSAAAQRVLAESPILRRLVRG